MITAVIREGHCYQAVDECGDEIAVLVPLDYHNFPYTREIKVWWAKKDCIILPDCHPL